MVIAPVDQRYFDIGSLERPCCRDAGKATADDQDAFLVWDRLCHRWLFLRERFGQNCSHECTHGFWGQPPDEHRIQRGFGRILNGAAVHRTSMPLFMLARALRARTTCAGGSARRSWP